MLYHVIGLMSGTSLDGLDICYAAFEKSKTGQWHFEILQAETMAYPKIWEEKLGNAYQLNANDLLALNSEYGFYLGEEVQQFISKNKITYINLIASHGHTVFHQPQRKFTLQIGDGRAIKIINQLPVVYDFRTQDVLMGGNGAPLVPIGDELLFNKYDACLNLGGFSNISLKKSEKRIAFDIGPVNIVLNEFAQKQNHKYDENGNIARNGNIDKSLLQQLNNLDFYQQNPPKSLGLEWVIEHIYPLLKDQKNEDILATFTEHIAEQIAKTFNENQLKNVLFTGGGTYNGFLIERIKSKTTAEIVIPKMEIIDFKEALIFGLMGLLRYNRKINILASATGSSNDHCSGILV